MRAVQTLITLIKIFKFKKSINKTNQKANTNFFKDACGEDFCSFP